MNTFEFSAIYWDLYLNLEADLISSHRVRPHSGGILREETRVGKRSRTDA
mgnify:CR=1 FL=1